MAGTKLSFDYAKWDKLEISDDEETFHPNLDKGLNVRVNRMTRDRKEDEIDQEKEKLEKAGETDKAAKLETKRPLHVGNLCHVADERTIINTSDGKTYDNIKKDGENFSIDDYGSFKEDNMKLLEAFTNADWEQSRAMLMEMGHLLMDQNANNYFMLTALEEQMKGNTEKVKNLGRQGQIISQIYQLAEPMKRPPRDLVPRFFEKFEREDSRAAFQEGVDHFLKHLAQRAVAKKKEQEEEEKQAAAAAVEEEELKPVSLVEAMYTMTEEERKGPGGLDPVEVFESLPVELQECFKSGDVERLKKVAQDMPTEEFESHFQRCIDAGLWSGGGS